MAPGILVTKTGTTTGKIRIHGAGETPVHADEGNLRTMKNSKKLTQKKRTEKLVKFPRRVLPGQQDSDEL